MLGGGKGGDLVANDGVWTGTIPSGTAAGSMLRWRMTADFGGYVARRPRYKSAANSPQYFGVRVADLKGIAKTIRPSAHHVG